MKIDIEQLHKAHFTSGRKSGQTTYKLDSLIRVIQLGEFKNLVYQTTTIRHVDQVVSQFIRHLINAGVEYQYYHPRRMFAVRDGDHTTKVWFKGNGENLSGFRNCFVVED